MNYKIYKVGRKKNAPTKRIKKCVICGNPITKFRFEIVNDDNSRIPYDVSCIVEKYFAIKKKWWSKFLGI